jgi:hypothetical protein
MDSISSFMVAFLVGDNLLVIIGIGSNFGQTVLVVGFGLFDHLIQNSKLQHISQDRINKNGNSPGREVVLWWFYREKSENFSL